MSVQYFSDQCPCGHWGRDNELDRYVSMRCELKIGHEGPCKLVDQLAQLRIRSVARTLNTETKP